MESGSCLMHLMTSAWEGRCSACRVKILYPYCVTSHVTLFVSARSVRRPTSVLSRTPSRVMWRHNQLHWILLEKLRAAEAVTIFSAVQRTRTFITLLTGPCQHPGESSPGYIQYNNLFGLSSFYNFWGYSPINRGLSRGSCPFFTYRLHFFYFITTFILNYV